ncbi:hypothetical protein BO78DRAFT_11064 [Aspergillus sclerotiicarbonarius CBS 121057]|uniref:Uncharacterized protein n=1 Tax=Aspergillus sclerotiicarbonarius (strain CBS 121057 / IBT 28362) TaxID=1448318 RepID=A0A319EI03_ASPSB|nr:hypothetical protein BO78DRAFT_11064 [Aspergillus sclerotiicarbonarius CBS 121057]
MRITANRQPLALLHTNLNHRRLRIDQILDSLDYLERVLAMDLLAGLEPLDHIVNELLCHFLLQPRTIIASIHSHGINIQVLKSGRRVADLNRLLELQPTDQLLALAQLQLRIAVVRLPLNHGLEILQGVLVVQDGGIRKGSSPVSLDKLAMVTQPASPAPSTNLSIVGVELQRLGGIHDRKAICFKFDMCLTQTPSASSHLYNQPTPSATTS